MKDKSERWEALVERLVVGSSRTSSEVATSSIATVERETIPKFRCLKEGDDIITYLSNFEDYYDSWEVPKMKWPLRLLPLLTQGAADVYSSLPSSSKRDYDSMRSVLCKHFRVCRETYRQKLDDVQRKTGEHWTECARRVLKLVKGWTDHCKTADAIREWITADVLLGLMPRQVVSHVKEKHLATLEQTAQWADDFWLSDDWNYQVLPIPEQQDNTKAKSNGRRYH